jgi:urease subunit alpha
MAKEMTRREYAEMYGPSKGDRIRLADTELIAEIEENYITPGDECVFGGGKTMRDGLGLAPGVTAREGALDMVFTNLIIIDPVLGIIKADIGVKDGLIVGVGKAGNPGIMAGVTENMVISANTDVISAEGFIATPGGLDTHVHFDSAGLCEVAISSGLTTMLGGGLGPVTVGICSGGKVQLERMLQAAEAWPINYGYLGKGSSSKPNSLIEQIEWGAWGLKIHEDWGAMPAAITCCLQVADDMDFQVCLHTDTLNEAGFVQDTFAAINGRTIHMYHTEGAGGGHAPDIMTLVGQPNMLPSSTNPTNPFTVNTFDEHLDMTMVCHHLSAAIPEDVAFAESRIRAETIAAEDVLHDMGAISMMSSDSQGMGRIGEVICRTWQLADKMKKQRGPLPEDKGKDNDNFRIKRYVAKYTINPAVTGGIADYVGSLEPGKLADIVIWQPAFFGIKPHVVIKGGFPAWSVMGESNASLMTCEPVIYRPQWSAYGPAKNKTSMAFVNQAAIDNNIKEKYALTKMVVPVRKTRNLNKGHMLHNTYCPDNITINPETYEVKIDGEHITCEPAKEVALAQRYMLG